MMETSSEAQSRVLSEAVARVAALWSIGDDMLGEILGIAGNRAADLRNGTFRLARPDPAFRAGQYLVRLFQKLAVLIGDDRSVMAWLQTENMDLGGRPIDLIRTERGLSELLSYVETRRASS
ncbi:MbcA/ParS/Xre antitoxin family protein [Sphingopyxis kveilinensis]|uniref:MbcA/ParS/Xre antitoxin family protein n=1 Tax=Sphingopyxis kveilinensis TaxID=3114367 RepID=UPI0030D4C053